MNSQVLPSRLSLQSKPKFLYQILGKPLMLLALLIFSLNAPFHLYIFSLAGFGLAHILYEMRYVQKRFATLESKTPLVLGSVLLAALALLRFLGVKAIINYHFLIYGELCLIFFLIFVAAGTCLVLQREKKQNSRKIISVLLALLLCLSLAWGIYFAPVLTIFIFALGHNFTPLFFLMDAAPKGKYVKALMWPMLVFIIPLFIALGIFDEVFIFNQEFFVLPKSFSEQRLLGTYIPSNYFHPESAYRLFKAAVFAQVLHYCATIFIYPKLLANKKNIKENEYIEFWPSKIIALVILFLCLASIIPYAINFFQAKAFYGILAALHAAVEVPLLLLLLAGLAKEKNQT